jgi:hypothetical protein
MVTVPAIPAAGSYGPHYSVTAIQSHANPLHPTQKTTTLPSVYNQCTANVLDKNITIHDIIIVAKALITEMPGAFSLQTRHYHLLTERIHYEDDTN